MCWPHLFFGAQAELVGIESADSEHARNVALGSWAMGVVVSRPSNLGPASRPVAIPLGFDTSSDVKAQGEVELPIHIWWSEPKRVFDLPSSKDRLRVYELLLSEGDEDDVLIFVHFDGLRSLWDQLSLLRHVREAWDRKFPQLSGLS